MPMLRVAQVRMKSIATAMMQTLTHSQISVSVTMVAAMRKRARVTRS